MDLTGQPGHAFNEASNGLGRCRILSPTPSRRMRRRGGAAVDDVPSSPGPRPSQLPPPPQTTSDGQKRGALKLDRRHHSVDGRPRCSTTHPWTSFWTTPLLLGPLQLVPPERPFPVLVVFLVASDSAKDNTWPRHPSTFPYALPPLPIPPLASCIIPADSAIPCIASASASTSQHGCHNRNRRHRPRPQVRRL